MDWRDFVNPKIIHELRMSMMSKARTATVSVYDYNYSFSMVQWYCEMLWSHPHEIPEDRMKSLEWWVVLHFLCAEEGHHV